MPGILCEHCTAACCRYIALPIDEPTSAREYDDIRWYLMHQGVSVFVEDGDWYICLVTPCQHLQPDHRCGVYATRPRICREYTTENCDYHSGDYGWEQHFTCPEHLTAYQKEHPKGKKSAKRKRRVAKRAKRSGTSRSGRRRSTVKAHPDPWRHRRKRSPLDSFAAMTHDTRGIPLPVLRAAP